MTSEFAVVAKTLLPEPSGLHAFPSLRFMNGAAASSSVFGDKTHQSPAHAQTVSFPNLRPRSHLRLSATKSLLLALSRVAVDCSSLKK